MLRLDLKTLYFKDKLVDLLSQFISFFEEFIVVL